jgi:hypothetical protein
MSRRSYIDDGRFGESGVRWSSILGATILKYRILAGRTDVKLLRWSQLSEGYTLLGFPRVGQNS